MSKLFHLKNEGTDMYLLQLLHADSISIDQEGNMWHMFTTQSLTQFFVFNMHVSDLSVVLNLPFVYCYLTFLTVSCGFLWQGDDKTRCVKFILQLCYG